MRDVFAGYYSPTGDEYKRLWSEALIVLDTSTLLDLYRFPATARDELFSALELVQGRIWIPHQAGLEFQRQRSNVIAGERASSEGALQAIERMAQDAREKVEALEIEKRGLGLKIAPLFEDLDKFSEAIKDAVTKVRDGQPSVANSEPIRDRLDKLLDGCVGPAPQSQSDLDALTAGGDDRFARKIPPGYEDSDKEKNPNLANFNFDGLSFPRKFGDLILWRELINYVKANDKKVVMFITSERKEDWWWKEQGRTLGPRPELTREIMREGGVELFWMYGPDQFLKQSQNYTEAKVTQEAVDEIAKALMASPIAANWQKSFENFVPISPGIFRAGGENRVEERLAVQAVAEWLEESGRDVTINRTGFPDIVVHGEGGALGFEVRFQRSFSNRVFAPSIINAMLRGYHDTHEKKLDGFVLVIIMSEEDSLFIKERQLLDDLEGRCKRLLERYAIDGILLGSVVDGRFDILARYQNIRDNFEELIG